MTLKLFKNSLFKNLPKAVIFDTDNTLYPYEPSHRAALKALFNKASKTLGIAEADIKKTIDSQSYRFYQ